MTPLEGRAAELELLLNDVAKSSAGESCLALVSGDTGVGKTRLLAEVTSRRRGLVLASSCIEGGAPRSPIVAALGAHLGAALAPYPHLSRLLSLAPAQARARAATGPAAEALQLFEALTEHGPVCLVLDDLQWVDETTLSLLPVLLHGLQRCPFLVLGAHRADDVPDPRAIRKVRQSLRQAAGGREIRLEPLGREDTAAMMTHLLAATPHPALVDQVQRRTRGIPAYVEAMTLACRDLLEVDEAGLRLAPDREAPLPRSLVDSIQLRLDALTEAASVAIKVAAVAGTSFPPDRIVALTGDEAALDNLVAAGLLAGGGDGSMCFRHPLVREVILQELPWGERRAWHRRLAEALGATRASPGAVALHHLMAGDEPAARRAFVDAALSACDGHDHGSAARLFAQALAIWPAGEDDPGRLVALEKCARCHQVNGQLRESTKAWQEMLKSPRVTKDRAFFARVQRELANLFVLQGAKVAAVEAWVLAAEALEEDGCLGEAALALIEASEILKDQVLLERAAPLAERAVAIAAKTGDPSILSQSLSQQGLVLSLLGQRAGLARVTEGLALALDNDLRDIAGMAYRKRAMAHEYLSEYATELGIYHEAVDYCHRQGGRTLALVCMGCMAYAYYRTGEWKRARDIAAQVMADPGAPEGPKAVAGCVQGLIHLHRGELKQARHRLVESDARSRRLDIVALLFFTQWGLALLHEEEARSSDALQRYDQLLRLAERTDDRHDAVLALMSASSCFGRHGHRDDMGRCLGYFERAVQSEGNPELLGGLAFVMGEGAAADGDPRQALRQLEIAASHFERVAVPAERLRVRLRIGEIQLELGQPEAAAEHLLWCHRLAQRLGMRPTVARIAALMKANGLPVAEPRLPSARAAQGALTRRQLEVADLLAAGLTNRLIGKRLSLSVRTVDMHVAHLLGRLDCRTRAEAVAKLSRAGTLAGPAKATGLR